MNTYHITVCINGVQREYSTNSEDELMMDLRQYNVNGFPYSVARSVS